MTDPPPTHGTGAETIDWELDVDESPLSLGLAYAFPSILGGVLVLVGGALVGLVAAAVWDGNVGRALGLLAVAVFALLAHRTLPALFETNLVTPFFERFSRRGLLVGSLLGASVLLGSAWLHPSGPFVVFLASGVAVVLTAVFPTSGHADLSTETLVIDGSELPLQDVRGVRTTSIGTLAVCWLSYTRGVPTARRLVVLPTAHVDAVAALIEAAPESSDADRSTLGRAERLVAGLFGVGMAAIGPVLWLVLPSGDGRVIALYGGTMFGLLGLVLLWYAYRG